MAVADRLDPTLIVWKRTQSGLDGLLDDCLSRRDRSGLDRLTRRPQLGYPPLSRKHRTVTGCDLRVGRLKAPTSRGGVGCGDGRRHGVASAPRRRFSDVGFCRNPLAFDGRVDRGSADTEKLGTSSVLYSPLCTSETRCASCLRLSLGCFPRSRLLALGTLMPSRVRNRIRSDSNSATMARTLNSGRPTASVGS